MATMRKEINTILAALRYWQAMLDMGGPPGELMHMRDSTQRRMLADIADNSGKTKAMTGLEIDTLCEDLNTGKWALLRQLGKDTYLHEHEVEPGT